MHIEAVYLLINKLYIFFVHLCPTQIQCFFGMWKSVLQYFAIYAYYKYKHCHNKNKKTESEHGKKPQMNDNVLVGSPMTGQSIEKDIWRKWCLALCEVFAGSSVHRCGRKHKNMRVAQSECTWNAFSLVDCSQFMLDDCWLQFRRRHATKR